jgi:Protein of unknown function (DUF692)
MEGIEHAGGPAWASPPIPACAGIGLRAQHHLHVIREKPEAAWFEAHSENYFADGGAHVGALCWGHLCSAAGIHSRRRLAKFCAGGQPRANGGKPGRRSVPRHGGASGPFRSSATGFAVCVRGSGGPGRMAGNGGRACRRVGGLAAAGQVSFPAGPLPLGRPECSIVLLNNPFRGQSHVSVEPFNRLLRSVATALGSVDLFILQKICGFLS